MNSVKTMLIRNSKCNNTNMFVLEGTHAMHQMLTLTKESLGNKTSGNLLF